MKRTILIAVALLSSLLGDARVGFAYQFAHPYREFWEITSATILADHDVVLLGSWVRSQAAVGETAGFTEFKIERIGKDNSKSLEEGQNVKLDLAKVSSVKPKSRYLLKAYLDKQGQIEWNGFERFSDNAFDYLLAVPALDLPETERLPYYFSHIGSKDRFIEKDVGQEFNKAEFASFVAIADQLPRNKIHHWLNENEYWNSPEFAGWYGMMLGLCGVEEDAALLDRIISDIRANPTEFFVGLDGIIIGYLLLKGEAGLDEIDKSKLKNQEVLFADTYAVMEALRFLWKHMPERISKERLKQSMRLLLDRPDFADLVIRELYRWEDWDDVDRVIEMYDKEEFENDATKQAIIRYLLTCAASVEPDVVDKLPRHVRVATQALYRIHKQDPENYKDAQRFFRLH